jgi:large subunit ribosomal protein L6
MSKIGRKPITIDGLNIDIKGQAIHYKGAHASGVHHVPAELSVTTQDNKLFVSLKSTPEDMSQKELSSANRLWGLHRALLANELGGATQEFEKTLEINGLGYKAALAGKKIIFTLGYSHKIEKYIPSGISVEIDKPGQRVKVKSSNRFLVGQFCSEIKELRLPEPYKGKGIKLQGEVIFRKAAGKGKK